MGAPRVSLLYWSGCPSWRRALEMVREEMTAAGLDSDALEVIELIGEEGAARHGFPGSPTIRIEGDDIEDPGNTPIGLTCRVYRRSDGRVSPLPDRKKLADGLRRARRGGADG